MYKGIYTVCIIYMYTYMYNICTILYFPGNILQGNMVAILENRFVLSVNKGLISAFFTQLV